MKRPKPDLDTIEPVRFERNDIAPELEACLEELLPDHDPRAVLTAVRAALNELREAQRRVLN